MPIKIFSLRGVPDDEADEVRALLTENRIDYYETPPGSWGISMPAIWLSDAEAAPKAKRLIERYQLERSQRARDEHARLRAEGKQRTLSDVVSENPIRFIVYLAAAAAMIYFSTKPFIDLWTS